MKTLTDFELWYGRDAPPQEVTLVRAGPVHLVVENGDLRYIRVGDREIVRRIYMAIRDRNWNTIPGSMTGLALDASDDEFLLTYSMRHSTHDIEYSWDATITGGRDGGVAYEMKGYAHRAFSYCRIGLCVLLPPKEYAGRGYVADGPEPSNGMFPEDIGPQLMVEGVEAGLFPPFDSLSAKLAADLQIDFRFAGELFEMEDQRNWTDASFKIYGTPIALGYPHETESGSRFEQRVDVVPRIGRVRGGRHVSGRGPSPTTCIEVRSPLESELPPIGLGLEPSTLPHSERDVRLLRELNLSHLRLDVDLTSEVNDRTLVQAEALCSDLDCGLELALFVDDDADRQLRRLAGRLEAAGAVERVMVFHSKELTTPPEIVDLARARLGPGAGAIGGGTNYYFMELNRLRPNATRFDFVSYTVNPQIHAFDERSLVETLLGQAATVASARKLAAAKPIVVSRVTLRPPFNADAVFAEPDASPDQLPPSADPRQMSLFAAAWTIGSVKYLSESGAASLTYYETVGCRGVMETESGTPYMDFPSVPGMIYPVYWVLRTLGSLRKARLLSAHSSAPLRVDCLAVASRRGPLLFIANFSPAAEAISLSGLDGGRARIVLTDCDALRRGSESPGTEKETGIRTGQLTLELPPHAVAFVQSLG